MEYTKQKIYEIGREKFVADIVSKILKDANMDDNEITEVELEDFGNCIHITFTGGVCARTIIEIGEAFGCDDPTVWAEGKNIINLVVVNNKYDCLIDTTDING